MFRSIPLKLATLAFASLVMAIGTSQASIMTQTFSTSFPDPIDPLEPTDWGPVSVELPKFEGPGELCKVTITLTGLVSGTFMFEHQDPTSGATVEGTLMATISASGLPGGASLSVTPTGTHTESVAMFDGALDFDGPSGFGAGVDDDPLLEDTVDKSLMYTAAADLALFAGLGTFSVDVSADGESMATGSGNITTNFTNAAGAILTVQYDYKERIIPEPTSAIIWGLAGTLGFITNRRRRLK